MLAALLIGLPQPPALALHGQGQPVQGHPVQGEASLSGPAMAPDHHILPDSGPDRHLRKAAETIRQPSRQNVADTLILPHPTDAGLPTSWQMAADSGPAAQAAPTAAPSLRPCLLSSLRKTGPPASAA
ncbi:hypothetical protein AUP43_05445 [Oceanibaculum pacificum]|uniref:Uncharacterized protein n=1 Tax=Oceanibaculum pacificum TaxID=580166 RepID=A0A154WEY4_9PROT|nr:hypothetical protein AUP43_05445 [Oceanibaculum pacificum]